jgi:signal transduction histidine kinase
LELHEEPGDQEVAEVPSVRRVLDAGWWRLSRGPLLTVMLVVVSELLRRQGVPIVSPVAYTLAAVVFTALLDGVLPGLLSAGISMGYNLYFFSDQAFPPSYSGPSMARLAILVAVTFPMAVLVGRLQARSRRLYRELENKNQELAGAVQAKTEFMNAAAHELRTPLSVISGYISMLEDGTFGKLEPRLQKAIDIVDRKTRELSTLVADILMSARLEAGIAPAAVQRMDMREAVREAVDRAEPRVTLLGASLSFELPATPVVVDIDRDHLARILDNLVNNALSYSREEPEVKITVSGRGVAMVAVEDHGVGLPDEAHERIFERFVRHQDPTLEHRPGTGLGLSISRDLAAQHGGTVILDRSEPGLGSTFVLRLPVADGARAEAARRARAG